MKYPNLERLINKHFTGAKNIKAMHPGGNGIPYSFEQNNKKYFIKLIDPNRAEKQLEGQEEKALRKVDSKYVIDLLEENYLSGTKFKFLLFPFIEGKDLYELIVEKQKIKKPFSSEEIKKIAIQIAYGIADMWKVGIAHQDIKPKNIRISDSGKIIILDLGIARFRDEPRRAKGKGSYKYSSPQQISAMIGSDNESVLNTFNFFSDDHFALGTIMYEMATLTYPFGKGESHDIMTVKPKGVLDLNSTLDTSIARIITKLMNKKTSGRYYTPSRLIQSLENKNKEEKKLFPNPVIFFQHGHHSGEGYSYFFEEYKQKAGKSPEDSLEGVVLSTSYLPNDKFLNNTKKQGLHIIIDPETYRLAYADCHIPEKLRETSYGTKRLTENDFYNNQFVTDWTKKVLDYQVNKGSTILISPYFIVENPQDSWDAINTTLLNQTSRYISENEITLPLFATLALSRSIICNERSRTKILDDIMFRDDIKGVFLIVQDEKDSCMPCDDLELLTELSKFIGILERRFSVLLPFFDTSALFLITNGLSAFATTPKQALRKFSLARFKKEKSSQKGMNYIDKVYVDGLMSFVRVTGELDVIVKKNLQNELFEKDSPFLDLSHLKTGNIKWTKSDRMNHYLFSISRTVYEMGKLTKSQRAKYIKEKVTQAIKLYKKMEDANIQLHEHSKGTFLTNWGRIQP